MGELVQIPLCAQGEQTSDLIIPAQNKLTCARPIRSTRSPGLVVRALFSTSAKANGTERYIRLRVEISVSVSEGSGLKMERAITRLRKVARSDIADCMSC